MDSVQVKFCPFCGQRCMSLTRFCFSCGQSFEFLNAMDEMEGPNAQGTSQQSDDAKQSKCSMAVAI